MIKLSQEVKRAVFDKIVSIGNFYGKYADGTYANDDLNVVNFLKQIWDLPAMKSEDPRFRNAEADAIQHLINNDDWDTQYVYGKRFNLLAGDQKYFVKFVELVVSPFVRHNREEMEEYVNAINDCLRPATCELAIYDYLKDEPVYRIQEGLGHSKLPIDMLPNEIKIYVDSTPENYPSFRLNQSTWDDFGYKTRYDLYYYSDLQDWKYIGEVKIMKKGEKITYGHLPTQFDTLTNEYCSLGQDLSYYRNMKKYLGNRYKDVLYALMDSACFSLIADKFQSDSVFRVSLLREREADRALQFAQYELAGYDYKQDCSFVFRAEMPYYKGHYFNVKFNFGSVYREDNLNRIIAVIGNNGVGKTTLLSQMAEVLIKGDDTRFNPQVPIFSKVIATSYSIFDDFCKIQGTSFNYVYCGMQTEKHRLMDEEELAARRRMSIELIKNKDFGNKTLKRYLQRLIAVDLLNQMFDSDGKFSEKKYQSVHEWLSSGQTMLMNLVIEILAHVRQNTLILIDEPEVHLHPQGITEIVRMIDSICKDYNSCCLMATHSPVVIQELLSRNVIVMDREQDGSPLVRPMRLESMGENLTTITQDIFGRNNKVPLYVDKLRELVDSHNSIEDVLKEVQNNDIPVSMSMFLMLDKMFAEK